MKESIRILQEDVKRNLTEENEVNALYQHKKEIVDYLIRIPDGCYDDMGGPLEKVTRNRERIERMFYDTEGTVERRKKGMSLGTIIKSIYVGLGKGKQETASSREQDNDENLIEKRIEKMRELYLSDEARGSIDDICGGIPGIKESHKKNEHQLKDFKERMNKSRTLTEYFMREGYIINNFITQAKEELKEENLLAEEYRCVTECISKLEGKGRSIDNYLKMAKREIGLKNDIVEMMKKEDEIFNEAIMRLERETCAVKSNMEFLSLMNDKNRKIMQYTDTKGVINSIGKKLSDEEDFIIRRYWLGDDSGLP